MPKKKKLRTDSVIRLRAYDIIDNAVEVGIMVGYKRSLKHTSTPTEEDVQEAVKQAVMAELIEILDFRD